MLQKKEKQQMSETIRLGIVLAIAGGFMDAYSYILRDHVFANAQTGNMLLLGVNVSEGNYTNALRYFFPVLSFAVGIAISEWVRFYYQKKKRKSGKISKLHWRQVTVLIELAVLWMVGFIPLSNNLLANCLTSLGCGIQVESFRKIRGNATATTMCIGNLRSATQHLCNFITGRKTESLWKSLMYFGIIFSFVMGAILGNGCIKVFQEKAILFCGAFLLIAFAMMFREKVDSEVTE